MQHFVKRPDHLEGMRFTGGRSRAEEIIQWLKSRNISARYSENGGAYNAQGQIFETEQVIVQLAWMEQGAYLGEWVTYDPLSGELAFQTHANFIKRWEEIPVVEDEVPTPEPEAPVVEEPVVEETPVVEEPVVDETPVVEEETPVVEEETPVSDPEVTDDTN